MHVRVRISTVRLEFVYTCQSCQYFIVFMAWMLSDTRRLQRHSVFSSTPVMGHIPSEPTNCSQNAIISQKKKCISVFLLMPSQRTINIYLTESECEMGSKQLLDLFYYRGQTSFQMKPCFFKM